MQTFPNTLYRYRFAGLVTAAVLVLLFWRLGFTPTFGIRAALALFFVMIAVIDLQEHRIPNLLVLPFGGLVLASALFQPELLARMLLGGVFAFAPFALAAILKPSQLGGGDIKLATVMGLLFGFPNIIWVLLLTVFSGGAVALYLYFSRRGNLKMQIAYGPFLCLGALLGLFLF